MNKALISQLLNISSQAGEIIMDIRKNSTEFSVKDDNTPITEADIASHEFILNALSKLTPNIPILSEESSHI